REAARRRHRADPDAKRCGGTSMLTATQFVATLCSALFTGAAIYVNLVEHPARMSCDTKIAATVWAPSYQRGAVMQASLAILSFMAGAAAWWFGGGFLWVVGGAPPGVGGSLPPLVVQPPEKPPPPPPPHPAPAGSPQASGAV